MKKVLCIILAVALVLSAVPVMNTAYAAADESGSEKKTLRVATKGDPSGLCHVNYTVASANTPSHQIMMDRLFDYDYETGEPVPMLATGWEQLSDKTFRITIRDDVYSWNGDKFKASDVFYTIKAAIDSGKQARYYGNFDIEHFVVEDDTHIVLALKNADPFIQTMLSNMPYGMLCQASVEAGGGLDKMNGTDGTMPNCYTGPYKPVEWELGSYIRFVKNENYWGDEPYFDEIIIYVDMDASSRAQKLVSGEADLVIEPSEYFVSEIEKNADLEVYAYPTTQHYMLITNTQKAPFDDVNVRRACALALNYDANIKSTITGRGVHSDDILPVGSPMYGSPAEEGYETYFRYDLAAAKAYMARSGYAGQDLEVEIYYAPVFSVYAELVKQQWAEIGITVSLTQMMTSSLYQLTQQGEFQAYFVNNSNPDPYQQLKFYDGAHFGYRDLNGGPGWNGGAEVTQLFDQITSTSSLNAAESYYKALRRKINDQVPSIPLYSPEAYAFGVKGIEGIGLTGFGDIYFAKARMAEETEPTEVYPITFYVGDDIWTKKAVQVSDLNKDDVLGDGGTIKFDPLTNTLTLTDPDLSWIDTGEYAESALVIGDIAVTIKGNGTIPTIYSEASGSNIILDGDFSIASMYYALSTSGTVTVNGGTLNLGCNGIPIEASTIVINGGTVNAEAGSGYALRSRGDITINGGTVNACVWQPYPAIYAENGTISIGNGVEKVSAYVDEQMGYAGDGNDVLGVVAAKGIVLGDELVISEPARGKISQVSYNESSVSAITNSDGTTFAAKNVIKHKPEAPSVYATDNGSSLSLKDKISVNIYVGIPDNAEGWTAKLYYEKNGFDEPISTYALNKTSANGYSSKNDEYKFVYSNISAKEMTEKVRVKIFDENGAAVAIMAKDGSFVDSIDFCAADWANTMISDPERPAKTVNLAKALLNLGGEAQNYWEYKPEANANVAGYLAEEMAKVTANDLKAFAPVKDSNASAVGSNGISLSLKSETYLNVYFTKEVTVSATNLNGAKIAVSKSGKEWVAKITGITAKNLGTQYTLTVKNGSTTSTQKYSALSWAYNILDGTSEKAKPLAKALYLYQQAAVEYFK